MFSYAKEINGNSNLIFILSPIGIWRFPAQKLQHKRNVRERKMRNFSVLISTPGPTPISLWLHWKFHSVCSEMVYCLTSARTTAALALTITIHHSPTNFSTRLHLTNGTNAPLPRDASALHSITYLGCVMMMTLSGSQLITFEFSNDWSEFSRNWFSQNELNEEFK